MGENLDKLLKYVKDNEDDKLAVILKEGYEDFLKNKKEQGLPPSEEEQENLAGNIYQLLITCDKDVTNQRL